MNDKKHHIQWQSASHMTHAQEVLFSFSHFPSFFFSFSFFLLPHSSHIHSIVKKKTMFAPMIRGPTTREEYAQRGWMTPNVENFDCSARPFTPGGSDSNEELGAFSSLPLLLLGLHNYVDTAPRVRSNSTVDRQLMIDVTAHKYAASHVGGSILRRLQGDIANFSDMQLSASQAFLKYMSEQEIQQIVSNPGQGAWSRAMENLSKLEKALLALREKDCSHIEKTIQDAGGYVNDVGAVDTKGDCPLSRRKLLFVLARTGEAEVTMQFDYLVSSLLSTRSDRDIQRLNPFIDERKTNFVYDLTISAILHACRVAQTNNTLDLLSDLTRFMHRLRAGRTPVQEAIKSSTILQEKVAQSLVAKRHFVKVFVQNGGVAFSFDPRYLVFEFAQDILIRKSQIELIDQFINTVANGGSMVSQMIMGAGKTTVVGPLLSLLLANGYQLVVQVFFFFFYFSFCATLFHYLNKPFIIVEIGCSNCSFGIFSRCFEITICICNS